jgi:hypothetical protein
MALVTGGCRLSGTGTPAHVCAAENGAGQRIACAASADSDVGDRCECVTRATGERAPEVFRGRVAVE